MKRFFWPTIVGFLLCLFLASCGEDSWKTVARCGAEHIVEKQLVAPSTAKFSNEDVVDQKQEEKNRKVAVALTVDAQNEYAAMIRKHYVVILSITNDNTSEVTWKDGPAAMEIADDTPTETELKTAKAANGWEQ